jgi:hypothetical protein
MGLSFGMPLHAGRNGYDKAVGLSVTRTASEPDQGNDYSLVSKSICIKDSNGQFGSGCAGEEVMITVDYQTDHGCDEHSFSVNNVEFCTKMKLNLNYSPSQVGSSRFAPVYEIGKTTKRVRIGKSGLITLAIGGDYCFSSTTATIVDIRPVPSGSCSGGCQSTAGKTSKRNGCLDFSIDLGTDLGGNYAGFIALKYEKPSA